MAVERSSITSTFRNLSSHAVSWARLRMKRRELGPPQDHRELGPPQDHREPGPPQDKTA